VIVTVERYNVEPYSHLLSGMFRLRARVFRDRLKWNVQVSDGMERDKYDDEDPAYLIYADAATKSVFGSVRLLPTTGPTLVGDVFADTLPDVAHLTSPAIWECTRFCVDEALIAERRESLVLVAANLIAALGEVALEAGIGSILGNLDAKLLRLYRRIGCEVEVLGTTLRHGRRVYLGAFAVTHAILSRIQERIRNGSLCDVSVPQKGQLAA
jgi:acyl homoserine lactone synthase